MFVGGFDKPTACEIKLRSNSFKSYAHYNKNLNFIGIKKGQVKAW